MAQEAQTGVQWGGKREGGSKGSGITMADSC